MNAGILAYLWNSTAKLHERFGTNRDALGANDAQLRVVAEEHFEFQYAAQRARDLQDDPGVYSHTNIDLRQDAIEEAADLIVTVIGVLQNLGISYSDLSDAMARVAAKNDSKTLETHYVNQKGKISRIE